MWTKIDNCGKQLTINDRIREMNDDQVKVYQVIEVEFDQYKLEMITRNDGPPEQRLEQTLTCAQLIRYGFEVENKSITV